MREMKIIWKNLQKKDVGAIGIGAMIIFIALILVAGVAASVLIQTSNSVQMQAMKTGTETMREVSGGVAVYNIEGQVNKTGNTINDMRYIAIIIKPRPGSGDIDLNNTYVLLSDGATKALLRYGGATNIRMFVAKSSAAGSMFGLINWSGGVNKTKFALVVMQDYDGSMSNRMTPVMNRGDKAVILIRCDTGNGTFARMIPERTEVFGHVVPERGSPGVIAFQTPMSYADLVYNLQ